jgi:hypothetical protein
MTKKAFDKIAAGLSEAVAVARGEEKPSRVYVPLANFEKNPGPDWIVEYRWLGENDEGVEAMVIFGAATSEIALQEAEYSLQAGSAPYVIFGAKRFEDEPGGAA